MDLRWIKGCRLVTMCYLLSILLQEGESALTLTTSPMTPTCGGTIVLTCTRDSALSSVTWNKNSVPIIVGAPKYVESIPGGFSATLTISDFQQSEEDNYYCGTGFAETSQTVRITCSVPTIAPTTVTKDECCTDGEIAGIVIGSCGGVVFFTGIIICICKRFKIACFDKKKKEEPDFIKYAKQELQWMDQKIAKIEQNVNGGTDAAAKLNKAEQGRLDTCEKRCKEEEEKLSKDATNSYGERIRDYINKLRVKMSELKKLQLEGNTLV